MSYANPNFTIITSGGCNAFCSFCTDPFKRKAAPNYLANLVTVLSQTLPAHFRQVSISGGEPTLSPDLPAILQLVKMSGHFDKVVLTTNGARLEEFVPLLKGTVHHLNVSRHALGYEANAKVFGTQDIIGDEALRQAAFELNKAGIDVNLNHVYTKDSALTVDYVLDYIDYARRVGASSVSFRYDQNENSLEPTYLEQLFSEWATVHAGGCPVCRNHTALVKGFPVVFKASFAEPSRAIDDVYELVYHITGKLTTDWEGKQEFTPDRAQHYVAAYVSDPHKSHPVVPHTAPPPAPSVKGKKASPPPAKRVSTKGLGRSDFDAVQQAVCARPLQDRLTSGRIYEILDTSTDTLDVRDDQGIYDSLPMTHFVPLTAELEAILRGHPVYQQDRTLPAPVHAALARVEAGDGPSFGGGCGSSLGGGCGPIAPRAPASERRRVGGGCGFSGGGGCS